ncbi:DUF2905 domain-containing protein [candidate division KSB1 bacterium]|nr:DUF2905 domain-containing protein [candidate division KSB1 bacterium]NIR73368.1 DUF2905 domain-containing protein [candidate division KSB1 bacterium]NIS25248.1 DUF2905 domain-containing protein [candidate division KSB1 bacterium]NIT72151.1 DUF2905 domain-containing protein [candidate division KSB1 bacterium]NIU25957.1 DUF2905 domain-containing protein [candidate division KSB1 bacterium]
MFSFESFGKLFIFLGIFLVAVGLIFVFFKHIPFLGKLPGDILIQKKNFTFYFPLTTSILISIIISIIFYFLGRR